MSTMLKPNFDSNMPTTESNVTGEYVQLCGEEYYRIANSHRMPEFFMSLVGASDHWMFVSSLGALTAGRCDPDSALFPYAADDQISIARSVTGPKTLIRVGDAASGERSELWQPFQAKPMGMESYNDSYRQNLYKTPLGNKLVFEEVNDLLGLVFRYRWAFSERFGFVRTCWLENTGEDAIALDLVDGLQNLLPYGVGSDFMMRFSNLANAYKKSELLADSGIGLFYLSSIPTDRAEPSEGLKSTVAWQVGLDPEATMLSTNQIAAFVAGSELADEADVRGRSAAYLVQQSVELAAGETLQWHVVADLEKDHSDIWELNERLADRSRCSLEIEQDIQQGEEDFLRILSSSDALQAGANRRRANRHLSSTVFNVMRGGIPLDDYQIDREDFVTHVARFNRDVARRNQTWLDDLPDELDVESLRQSAFSTGDIDLIRFANEYLPLAFSRRHGDPTRPWNRFAIKLRSESGRTNLDYQGNWRDIFQNWEALAISFPNFSTSMICRFVNATTADGYNPYRVTKDGFEWEEPTPEDPWANIGYWGDHQIIYLLKLIEWNRALHPNELNGLLDSESFVHANVPYRIKGFEATKRDPQDTIEFDSELSHQIATRVSEVGSDGKLLTNRSGGIQRVTLAEKLLTLSLAKLSNLVPDGGIWLNTQRPEWNDANNALVGNGLSMVTACYLYRWFEYLDTWFSTNQNSSFRISVEVAQFLQTTLAGLEEHRDCLDGEMTDEKRAKVVECLSRAGEVYRASLYESGPAGDSEQVDIGQCVQLFKIAKDYLQATIRNNRTESNLYHAYNILNWTEGGAKVEHLYEMLEGQVAVLSSGLLAPSEAVDLLKSLRKSKLYRENQNSYMLYPDRELPRFLEKNNLGEDCLAESVLLRTLLEDGEESIVQRDLHGRIHFNGAFRNSADLRDALAGLPDPYQPTVAVEREQLVNLFEDVFQHRQFTGRSGTFFAYEGLGSIYWHMVSKLGLAVSENFFAAFESGAEPEIVDELWRRYQDIRQGIGSEKTPTEYGAFPSDPYSHTPENAGAKQPGMTGQVKEDILARFAEIGVHFRDGQVHFRFEMFDRNELQSEPGEMRFYDLSGQANSVEVPEKGFAFTLCQVPVVYHSSGNEDEAESRVCVHFGSGEQRCFDELSLDRETSRVLFSRSDSIRRIEVRLP
ncbi:MAG: hypothetical protein ACE361_02465 [Aureliella sp.]